VKKIDKKLLRRVVRVLLNKLPKDEAVLISTLDKLTTLQNLFRKDKTFRNFVLNPSIPPEEKLKLIDILDEKLKLNDVEKELLRYILKNRKGNLLKYIADEFRFEVEKLFSTVKGEIISAYPLDEETIENVKATIEKKLGKKVEFEFEVKQDPSIIGGIIVKAGSYILDASIKNFLHKLEQKLTQYG